MVINRIIGFFIMNLLLFLFLIYLSQQSLVLWWRHAGETMAQSTGQDILYVSWFRSLNVVFLYVSVKSQISVAHLEIEIQDV